MENDTTAKRNKAKKIVKIVLKILYQILIILCVILTIIIVLQRVTNSNRTIMGYRIFRVITGSMEPEYDIGVVVICKETPVNEIDVGDDIVYLGTYGDYNGKIIMHEVIGIDKDENNNNVNFHAKGLHSASLEDPEIKPNQIFGTVKHKSGILTILYDLATSIYSSFIIISVLVLNVFISFKFSGKTRIQKLEEQYEEIDEEYIEVEDVDEEVEFKYKNGLPQFLLFKGIESMRFSDYKGYYIKCDKFNIRLDEEIFYKVIDIVNEHNNNLKNIKKLQLSFDNYK